MSINRFFHRKGVVLLKDEQSGIKSQVLSRVAVPIRTIAKMILRFTVEET